MLIEFRVANFRSIRDEQTFSLVASNSDKALPDCVIERSLPGLSGLRFLKGAAIYGANASGKSNVIEAVRFLGDFVESSATGIKPGDPTGTTPFKLDRKSKTEPSRFEITFVADGVRYVFNLAVTSERVIEESLAAYPKGARQRWYRRVFDEESQDYEWANPSTAFRDDKGLRRKTRKNSLFLSVGPQFDHPQLTPVFDWFRKNLHFLNLGSEMGLHPSFTASMLKDGDHRDRLIQLLRTADFGINDATVTEEVIDSEKLLATVPPAIVAELEKDLAKGEIKRLRVRLTHQAEGDTPVLLSFDDEESAGTQRFFSLIGPWLDILENGYTVFIDEIETSLHPILVRELLRLLLHGEANTKGAQIVFTTHNPVLLDNTLLRRDQIWFTEKTRAGFTSLYPLTDYKPRKDEALARGYLAGRYGAIPFIPDGLDQ